MDLLVSWQGSAETKEPRLRGVGSPFPLILNPPTPQKIKPPFVTSWYYIGGI